MVADGQTKPALHRYAVEVAFPTAGQLPASHAVRAATVVAPVPPAENMPAGHADVVVSLVPAGQNWPAGHAACSAPPEDDVPVHHVSTQVGGQVPKRSTATMSIRPSRRVRVPQACAPVSGACTTTAPGENGALPKRGREDKCIEVQYRGR